MQGSDQEVTSLPQLHGILSTGHLWLCQTNLISSHSPLSTIDPARPPATGSRGRPAPHLLFLQDVLRVTIQRTSELMGFGLQGFHHLWVVAGDPEDGSRRCIGWTWRTRSSV